jgi:hypothetical protein
VVQVDSAKLLVPSHKAQVFDCNTSNKEALAIVQDITLAKTTSFVSWLMKALVDGSVG